MGAPMGYMSSIEIGAPIVGRGVASVLEVHYVFPDWSHKFMCSRLPYIVSPALARSYYIFDRFHARATTGDCITSRLWPLIVWSGSWACFTSFFCSCSKLLIARSGIISKYRTIYDMCIGPRCVWAGKVGLSLTSCNFVRAVVKIHVASWLRDRFLNLLMENISAYARFHPAVFQNAKGRGTSIQPQCVDINHPPQKNDSGFNY